MKKANVNPNPRSSVSQTKAIMNYMLQGNVITAKEAREKFGCDRLGARIMDIEKIVGYKPPRKMVSILGRDALGEGIIEKRVMSYWLNPEN